MKPFASTLKTLLQFASLNDFFMVMPPNRFLVFGEGKRGKFRGLSIEGRISQTFQTPHVFSFEALREGSLAKADLDYDPLTKVDDFNALIDAEAITSFEMSRQTFKLIRKVDARRNTHVRFYKKTDGHTKARVFDARKYFASSIDTDRVDDYAEIAMLTDAQANFYFYVELSILKKLPLDDYEVVVLDNEMITFEGLKSGLRFHLRDQRLGEQMEERISDLGSYDEVFFIDIERVKPSSADWKSPNAKRRVKL